MAEFTVLLPEVLPHLPQVNEPLFVTAARRTVRKFCEETDLVQTTTSPYIDIVADQAEYTLPAVANREIVRGLEVWWGDEEMLIHRSEDQLDREQSAPRSFMVHHSGDYGLNISNLMEPWRIATDAIPSFWYQPNNTTVRLVGIPDASATAQLKAIYSLKPDRTATEIDDTIIDPYYEQLTLGILAELFIVPKKPWTDLEAGSYYRRQFESALAEVSNMITAGFDAQDHAVGRVRTYT